MLELATWARSVDGRCWAHWHGIRCAKDMGHAGLCLHVIDTPLREQVVARWPSTDGVVTWVRPWSERA